MAKLSDLHNAIVKGNLELAVSTTQEALQENIDPQPLISAYLGKLSLERLKAICTTSGKTS